MVRVGAHMGPYGPKRYDFVCKINNFNENHIFFVQKTLFDSFKVFFRFLTKIRFRTIMELPQKAISRTRTCSFRTSVTLP